MASRFHEIITFIKMKVGVRGEKAKDKELQINSFVLKIVFPLRVELSGLTLDRKSKVVKKEFVILP